MATADPLHCRSNDNAPAGFKPGRGVAHGFRVLQFRRMRPAVPGVAQRRACAGCAARQAPGSRSIG